MKEKELEKLLFGKEPSELTIEELKKIIPTVNDRIIKTNLKKILEAKELECSIALPLVFEDKENNNHSEWLSDIETPFD